MNSEEMIESCKAHTFYTWSVQGAVNPLPISRAEGIYIYTPEGKRLLDFNSGLMCVNIGHSHPKVVEAVKRQADELMYAMPGSATPIRARVGKLMAEITPGDINTFFFTLGGAEANENAIRLAKLATGRQKILSRYRSYHGATNLCMQLTGDPRRWANEPGMPGVIRVMDPDPYTYEFGKTEAEKTENNLRYLEEVIMYEGPQNIAAMIIETVTGTNGVLPPPAGYLKGLRELLDRHGILLICDEVMAGFGRTGKMFAFEHGDILPDLVSMAKGLTSAAMPLGCVGIRDHVKEAFQDTPYWGGLTYNSHPMSLAAGEAAIKVIQDENLLENAERMGKIMRSHMEALKAAHPCVKTFRQIGLFGMVDMQKNRAGERLAPYNGTHPAQIAFLGKLRELGLFTFARWGSFMCNPPLCITEAQMSEAFGILDEALHIVDAAMED